MPTETVTITCCIHCSDCSNYDSCKYRPGTSRVDHRLDHEYVVTYPEVHYPHKILDVAYREDGTVIHDCHISPEPECMMLSKCHLCPCNESDLTRSIIGQIHEIERAKGIKAFRKRMNSKMNEHRDPRARELELILEAIAWYRAMSVLNGWYTDSDQRPQWMLDSCESILNEIPPIIRYSDMMSVFITELEKILSGQKSTLFR